METKQWSEYNNRSYIQINMKQVYFLKDFKPKRSKKIGF